MERHALIVIGAGPAGLAAAIAAKRAGVDDVMIFERGERAGGILNQCVHNGFGLHHFQEELTGPEYAQRFIDEAESLKIPILTNAMVLDLTNSRILTVTGREIGLRQIQADAVILAMGCRERPRGALNIPGFRPAGIYTAGTAQRMINIEGRMPGREIVILGSGDIGLIMARRLTLEGARVKCVAELMPHSSGLPRNIAQCLDDFGIPLLLRHTVTEIRGKRRVEGVVLAEVDENRRPISGTEREITCDTLLLSCGLLPENELSRQAGVEIDGTTRGAVVRENFETNVKGIFACGNVLHVHDLADNVSEEASAAGLAAAAYLRGEVSDERDIHAENDGVSADIEASNGRKFCVEYGGAAADGTEIKKIGRIIRVENGHGVIGAVPQRIDAENMPEKLCVRFRVTGRVENCAIAVFDGTEEILSARRRVVTPGQMEEILLKKENLRNARGNIRIEIVKRGN